MGMNISLINGMSIDDDFLYAFKKRTTTEDESIEDSVEEEIIKDSIVEESSEEDRKSVV